LGRYYIWRSTDKEIKTKHKNYLDSTQSFSVEDAHGVSLQNKLSEKVKDSLNKLAQRQVANIPKL